ncbi:ABC1 kinase family protein [Vallicoccus soli]|uniref:AarF/ABC1/UbiB kinase family protein n=1 Tax=Vallicoccus soli TaxID=2339232 RepID=A0A3A3Z325_9ACTN|nr:AarF/UbiB family protein [Vallicoccus soli]RJK97109.1 AarF/ABC1/UbiB kinase family protein [Vallicoccus soli]
MLLPRARRWSRLAALPAASLASAAEGLVRTRLLRQDHDAVRRLLRRRGAERTRRVLGGMKGGALKAGQLLATVDALFPPDPEGTWSAALRQLPEEARGVPFPDVAPALRGLGADWGNRLPDLDPVPVAAASIGQVHRATWREPGSPYDGVPVAVKLQYPGVADAIAADLAAVSLATRAASLVARGAAAAPLVAELRTRLREELDYAREARVQRAFAAAYRDDPEVALPDVVAVGPGVLVTTWLEGVPLVGLADAPRDVRDAVGERYQRFLLSGPARAGWLHTDPHPGNFRRCPDGRLGVLDLGSALELPHGLPESFGRLIGTLARGGEPADVEAALRGHGLLRPGARLPADDLRRLADVLSPFTEPARSERFTFGPEWLRGQFARGDDARDPDPRLAMQLALPAEHLFTHRVWLGVVGVLCMLRATVPERAELERWLPGFSAAA